MSNRLYILSDTFLIEALPLYSVIFTYFYYGGLLLSIVLVDTRKYKLLVAQLIEA
jgi:hypothetical protein